MQLEEKWLLQPGFSWPAAYGLASATGLSYSEPGVIEDIAWRKWGLLATNFAAGDVRGYMLHGPYALVIIFRGTDSIGDVLSNLDAFRIYNAQLRGDVHQGFLQDYQSAAGIIRAAVRSTRAKHIWYVGHSSGGALALLAAMHNLDYGVSGVFTFGQPRLLSEPAAATVEEKLGAAYCRFAATDDLVTQVPPGFWHTGALISFDPEGNVLFEGARVDTPGATSMMPSMSSVAREVDGAIPLNQFDLLQSGISPVAQAETGSEQGSILFELTNFFANPQLHYTSRYIRDIFPYALEVLGAELVAPVQPTTFSQQRQ